MQAMQARSYYNIELDANLFHESLVLDLKIRPSPKIDARYHSPQEEIALGPACWLVSHILSNCAEVHYWS